MNRAAACLHRFVVETCEHPVLKRMYEILHRAGLLLVQGAAFLDPSIESLLVRNNVGSSSRPVPGLSDYDLTLIFKKMSVPSQLAFLRRLWTCYRLLKRAFPMLGEVDVLSVDSFNDYLEFGPGPTVMLKKHTPLFVKKAELRSTIDDLLAQEGMNVSSDDILNQVIQRYILFAGPRMRLYLLKPTRFNELSLKHAVRNIANALPHMGYPAVKVAEENKAVSCYGEVLKQLTKACAFHGESRMASKPVVPFRGQGGSRDEVMTALRTAFNPLWQGEVSAGTGVLWNSFLSHDKFSFAIVLDDDCPTEYLISTAGILAQGFQSVPDVFERWFRNDPLQNYFPVIPHPVLLTRSLWKAWMRLNPLTAASVNVSGAVLFGDKRVIDDAVPEEERVLRSISVRYAATLSLQNNRRSIPFSTLPLLYLTMNDHVQAYLEALKGPIRTHPQENLQLNRAGCAVAEQYENITRSLQMLRNEIVAAVRPKMD